VTAACWEVMPSTPFLHLLPDPCMPSRNPCRLASKKPRVTSHSTRAIGVTRGVWRGLVRLELLPICCRPMVLNIRRSQGQRGLCRAVSRGVVGLRLVLGVYSPLSIAAMPPVSLVGLSWAALRTGGLGLAVPAVLLSGHVPSPGPSGGSANL
jgi:hypothetical protein